MADVAEFLKHLQTSRLLSGHEVASARARVAGTDVDALTLAKQLVQQKKLTSYQARQLLARRSKGFFVGSYKILEPLGRGGMGVVFKVEHTVLRRLAALKVLPLQAASDYDSVTRFRREARAIAQLEHDAIVRVYDVGQQGAVHFIAMEFVPGVKLSRLIEKRGRLAPAEVAEIIHQVSLGLDHALERGVIHRDIKPANLMITPDNRVKILDMGLARLFGELADDGVSQQSLTQTGAVVGTVDYVAPEQAKDSRSADTRSDIYSLGCTMYHCLTGQIPFPGRTLVEKLLAHREEDPVSVAQLAPDVPEGLVEIVRKMMAKCPDDRFPRPADVAAVLSPFRNPVVTALAETRAECPPAARDMESSSIGNRAEAPPQTDSHDLLAASHATAKPDNSATPTSPASGPLNDVETSHFLDAIAAADVDAPFQPTPGIRPQPVQAWRQASWAVASAVVALILLGAWHWSNTNKGTVVIELAAYGAIPKIIVDGRPLVLSGGQRERVDLRAGAHTVVVDYPGLGRSEHSVMVHRGGEVLVQPKPRPQKRRRS